MRPVKPWRREEPYRECAFEGCGKVEAVRGLCNGHYAQFRNGEELRELWGSPAASRARFWSKVDKRPDGCWMWTGRTLNSGYGYTTVVGQDWLAHRYVYSETIGPIPEGRVIDHLCRQKRCVNPEHLRATTQLQNARSQGLRSNNTSGVRGVHWDKSRNRWAARVRVGDKKHHVGRFETLEEAAQAVTAARERLYSRG